ncbi:MAG: glycosyltransferase, partial [Bacteroidota bacterium]
KEQFIKQSTVNPMLLKGRDIVVIGLQPWYYEIGSNCKNIAQQFALHNRVLYVNLPINRKTFFSSNKNAGIQRHCDIIQQKSQTIQPIGKNFWQFFPTSIVESINWLPSTSAFKLLNGINNRRFARNIKKAVAQLGFSNIVLFNDNDFFNGYDLKKLLAPHLYIYYCRDYLRGYDYWKKHGDQLEPELIEKADIAVANSLYLAEYCSGFNKQSHYIGQGCNVDLFDGAKTYATPPGMAKIKSPIIGYVGAVIADRLDIKIIEIIAKANANWNVVLVGPEDEVFKNSTLHQMPNVHFIGRQPMEDLPAFVNSFDVCINPQLLNPITIGNYPLKVDEYLAMGKPVVATLTKTMELFKKHTYLAVSPEEYPALIEKALLENNDLLKKERITFARSHTWEACMKELFKVIEKTETLN